MTESVGTLTGRPVPDFTAPAVLADNSIVEDFCLKDYLAGFYGLIFFYPLDFTFVCPSEILAHDHRLPAFAAKEAKVVAISVDSQYSHLAWKKTPIAEGGLGPIGFPMVADISKAIARSFGVLLETGVALRASFLVDRGGIVRHQTVNDLPLGRNVDETLRMIDALRFHDAHGQVCPAGWKTGDPGMTASPEGVAAYLSANAERL
ncbi:peroxiredoxin [Rhodospirillum rubrum]|uniref:Thioredoxin peroxidase n=1 Tax=Rhodospirillum rubrum (strain ATCC 11170 / ATH 1.1.1 / DSM 467 / LMG 4362 / NCIMB 8255 / S1) TaxID=269796 RepID=Q2RQA1_RHORT|nr:peroxiredoxin [Rhodospirillum rubrum]ABC23694.1 Alkyl hydroperoxide reductase/ Thiol specific antioxidant/ Mal allergen [Rhodospirillum rubrum ATCC 11170]AEO49432.1 alkyl hydroperoxide reductase/ Thiol specific antioxidant/ Mal allergen [Rhodospirillum rubrum F11]MBK5955370.1 peroxiredoxin [Rhodospirillum rubrum]QXG79650.1 peroxiredoxin [Rhodospirillum rubrum]HAQ01356.1 peroxiredoxin [Rhodospirillum rubrum]